MRIDSFDDSKDFWSVYPELKVIDDFKKVPSEIMWAIHFCVKPNSMIYNHPEKWEKVKTSVAKDKTLNWDKYSKAVKAYEEIVLTPSEKYFHMFNELLENKRKWLKNFNFETANEGGLKLVEVMINNLHKQGQEYDKLKKLLKEDYSKTEKPVSFLDR